MERTVSSSSLRAQRSNPESLRGKILDCFATLAMTSLWHVLSTFSAVIVRLVRNCQIKEDDGGVLMNAGTQAPFTYKDACVELNPHVGGNPTTAAESRKAVVEFLQALFKLG